MVSRDLGRSADPYWPMPTYSVLKQGIMIAQCQKFRKMLIMSGNFSPKATSRGGDTQFERVVLIAVNYFNL